MPTIRKNGKTITVKKKIVPKTNIRKKYKKKPAKKKEPSMNRLRKANGNMLA